MAQETTEITLIYCPGRPFLAPYMGAEFGDGRTVVFDRLPSELPAGVTRAAMISTTKVYHNPSGRHIDEDFPVDRSCKAWNQEQEYTQFCEDKGLPVTILRACNVVCTGMTDTPMRIAEGVNSGLIMHIAGNEARISLIHGIDVAHAANVLAGKDLIVNITDGEETRIDEFIDALAYRMGNKRVFKIKSWMAKILYGKKLLSLLTETATFDNARAISATEGMELHPVTQYLTTHVYDHESL